MGGEIGRVGEGGGRRQAALPGITTVLETHQVIVKFVSGNGGTVTDAQSGRVEVIEAGESTGTVGLRVDLDGDTHVEGQFDVMVCN